METLKRWLQKDGEVGKFLRFCITGGLNTVVDFGLYTFLIAALSWNLYLSQFVGYSAGMAVSYSINRRWTFDSDGKFFGLQLVRFLAVSITILLISMALLYLFTDLFTFHYIVAKIFTIGITTIISFMLNRFFVFRRQK